MSAALTTPVLIIGSGIAGATCALQLADQGFEVTLLTAADSISMNNTALAQGGIIYKGGDDDAKDLVRDVLVAGWRHNYVRAVQHLARKGPEAVEKVLMDRVDVPFDRTPGGELSLTREGGHSRPRIAHCADFTGKAIMDSLAAAVLASPNIRILTNRTAIDLLTTHHHSCHLDYRYSLENQCVGAYVYNGDNGHVETLLADVTVLATGGVGQIYLHTTNTKDSIGSGLAMAYRAGAWTMNSEFVQFHPTALYQKSKQRFLVSEAVRGEGAKLLNAEGEAFMPRYDARADLAPRDIVTRAIMSEMLRSGEPCVFLDVANHVSLDLPKRFPTIHKRCMEAGIDMTRQPIPVVPAAHYFCGGVLTDDRGRTTLKRLYAVGECACTGIHGANRLASTSLLEGLLWGYEAGHEIARALHKKTFLQPKLLASIPDWETPGTTHDEDPALIMQDWAALRHTMWNYVGISRSTARLKRAMSDINNQYHQVQKFYRETPITKELVDLFHGCQTAYIITSSALRNTRTSGCHHRVD
ncbi:L-aspartate oxidase [Desulfovibrio sp. X2]|uniref:L-aspartate oxidase n=1 Tax=Desulfovibrio sp. X2 TaxID=941449 RepID=UPI000358E98A|nr:L-aspartate oxidase [Desulfovibrio sp. X2]EPR42253.1 L-aspartate oxidase [Desulfovibrio sp. X2]